MVYVYILQSTNDQGYYIGICKNLNERLDKHNRGGVRSTKLRRPLKIVYSENFNDYKQAREREIQLKSYKGGNEFKKLIN